LAGDIIPDSRATSPGISSPACDLRAKGYQTYEADRAKTTAVVDCNADHGGTTRLRSLAENADLFVVTWLSAKHAATDFIREHRHGRPLLYAQGRGFSSILRAVEDHIRRF
jgi:hypothetical protein